MLSRYEITVFGYEKSWLFGNFKFRTPGFEIFDCFPWWPKHVQLSKASMSWCSWRKASTNTPASASRELPSLGTDVASAPASRWRGARRCKPQHCLCQSANRNNTWGARPACCLEPSHQQWSRGPASPYPSLVLLQPNSIPEWRDQPPPPNCTCPCRRELDIHYHTNPIQCAK